MRICKGTTQHKHMQGAKTTMLKIYFSLMAATECVFVCALRLARDPRAAYNAIPERTDAPVCPLLTDTSLADRPRPSLRAMRSPLWPRVTIRRRGPERRCTNLANCAASPSRQATGPQSSCRKGQHQGPTRSGRCAHCSVSPRCAEDSTSCSTMKTCGGSSVSRNPPPLATPSALLA